MCFLKRKKYFPSGPPNYDHLLTTTTFFWYQGWSPHTGLTVFQKVYNSLRIMTSLNLIIIEAILTNRSMAATAGTTPLRNIGFVAKHHLTRRKSIFSLDKKKCKSSWNPRPTPMFWHSSLLLNFRKKKKPQFMVVKNPGWPTSSTTGISTRLGR